MSLVNRIAAVRARAALAARLGALFAVLAGSAASAATITIVPGAGFTDSTPTSPEGGNTGTTRGQQRLNVFQAAANVWGARLNSAVTIRVAASFASLAPCDTSGGVLGSAGPTDFRSDFANAPFAATWYPVALRNALAGTDVNGTGPEIDAEFNSDVDAGCLGVGSRFWYGIDPSVPVPANRIALFPVVLHEMGHGLGFLTITGEDGSFASGQRDVWTFFLKNFTTNELWKDMTSSERAASGKDDPDLVWDGPNVTAALTTIGVTAGTQGSGASRRLRMYAPNPFEPGSSVSHFSTAAAPNLLMEPILEDDVFVDVDFTVPLFQDIGWSVNGSGGGSLNVAPTVTAPASIAVTEDVATNLTGISIADPDVGSASMDARFQVTAGTLTALTASGITISGSGTATVTLSGTRANLNTYIANGNLRYTTAANDTTTRTLTITVDDNGNTGTGGVMTGTDTVSLSVNAVNDAPTIAAPAAYAVTEDTALPINGVTFADVDAASGNVTVTFTITSGALAGGSISGVAVTSTALTRTLVGTVSAINAYLAQDRLTYTPAANATAATALGIGINDGGNTGGSAQSASRNVSLNITAVNDAPTITAPASYAVNEDTALPIDTVSFADVDAATGNVTVTFTITSGVLAGGSISGVTVTATALTRTLVGTVSAINAYLAQDRLTYTPAANATAATTLGISINDGGNTGGSAQSASRNVPLNIAAVNDAPTLSAPATIAVTEDVPVSLAPITFADVDAGSGVVTVTYSITGTGTLSASSVAGVTVTGTSSMRILQGTVAALSSYVAAGNVTYRTAPDDATDTTLDVSISDGGNTGSGGALFANASVALDATAVNDAPVLGAPPQIAVADVAPTALAGFSVGDVDSDVATITVTFTVTDGSVVALPGTGVTIMGSGTASVVLTGTAADLDAYFDAANLTFVPDATADALVTLTVVADDQGNTGTGGARTATRTVMLDASLLFFDGFE